MSRPRARLLSMILAIVAAYTAGFLLPSTVPILLGIALGVLLTCIGLGADFFRGRAAMRRRHFEVAIERFQSFAATATTSRARIFRGLWLSLYTSNPLSLVHNNVGVCQLNLRRFEDARASFEKACTIDQGNALPHANLALLHHLLGDAVRAQEHAGHAVRLGYSQRALDRAARRILAKVNIAVGTRLERPSGKE